MNFKIPKHSATIVAVIFAFNISTAVAGYKNVDENIRAFCEKKWTKRGNLDVRMFNHCSKMQRKGLARIGALKTEHVNLGWLERAETEIANKWTKRGVSDYRMMAHSLGQEVEGYLNTQYALKQGEFDKNKVASCLKKWSNPYQRWQMIHHCAEK